MALNSDSWKAKSLSSAQIPQNGSPRSARSDRVGPFKTGPFLAVRTVSEFEGAEHALNYRSLASSMSKLTERTNLGRRKNRRHDCHQFGAGVNHHDSSEPVACEVSSNFIPVAMLSIRKSCIRPVKVMVEEYHLEALPGDRVDSRCTCLGELEIAYALTKPREPIFAVVQNEQGHDGGMLKIIS
jgi:hypothetical protein